MFLNKLIKDSSKQIKKIKILGIAVNSKSVKPGYIFFAINGNKLNGEKFISDAIKRGAAVIVCSKKCKYNNKKVPIIKTSKIRQTLSAVSSNFYSLKPKNIIAVTGTNGKTSVADLYFQILKINKIPVASIGTLGVKLKTKIIKSSLTTPETIFLHKSLEKIKKQKIDNVIIEASSHGLDQNRLDDIPFKAAIFTNLSQDHLDYHKTMKSYFKSKLLLFKKILNKKKIVISDSSIKEFSNIKKICKKRKLKLVDIMKIENRLIKRIDLNLNKFQIKNLSMAIAAAKLNNLSENKIFKSLIKIKNTSGRLELIRVFPNNIKVYVDFAHTPDALLKSIKALKSFCNSNISLVFGCGGDRDPKKRPIMAKIASAYCEKIYVTNDNPRNENPEKIRKEIIKNIKNKNRYSIGSRSLAIKKAIKDASPNDVILVAGKGHEAEQIFKNKIISISDKQIIKRLKLKIKKISSNNQKYLENKRIMNSIKKNNKIKNFHGLSIDSREVKKNNLFLTIKGKKNDGNLFIDKALRKGASFIISSKKNKKFKNKVVQVKNEINFLNKYASKKRDFTSAKIIAVTGSAGKTSLKNLIKELLENFGKTLCSPKSYNNRFGVPLSLSQLQRDHRYAVFEVGMSKMGEINSLTKLIRPQVGIITNIGEAHIENFKNLKGIAEAKSEMINNIEHNGTVILNRDDKFFKFLSKKAKLKNLKVVSFGLNKKSDVYPIKILQNKITHLILKVKNQVINLETRKTNIYNILSSLALLSVLNLNFKTITSSYKNHQSTEGRGKIHKIKRYKKNFKLIDESYNANPLSVKNAINEFKSIKKQNFKKYLILGDMLELGKKSEVLHKRLSKVINNSDIDKVFVKGSKTLTTYKNIVKNKRGNIFQQEEDVDLNLNNIIANNDYLMIKGSNATGLNNLSKRMIKGY